MKTKNFNKMSKEYPYLDNVNVFNYDIDSDPTVWDANTKIKILRVNWDRDYTNVVKFENDKKRDDWIDKNTSQELTLETEQYLPPNGGTIKIPLPFNQACKYNYLCVEFPDAPVTGGDKGVKRFFYFMDSVERNAASTTTVNLTPDYWTTYVNDTDITYMMLERGHAPMSAAPTPEEYLKNPINGSRMLLTPDVNYGGNAERSKYIKDWIMNDVTMYAVFITTADMFADLWGTENTDSMRIPGLVIDGGMGVYNYQCIAIPASDLTSFLYDAFAQIPYFFEAVQGMFYISAKMVESYATTTFAGHQIWKIRQNPQTVDLGKLTVDNFGYDAKYKNLTKLYTSPYAYLTVGDENGNQNVIRIEEIGAGGNVQAFIAANMISPTLNIQAHILNVGAPDIDTIGFKMSGDMSTKIGGKWQELMYNWNIPTFAVFADQTPRQTYLRYWQNKQAQFSYENSYASAIDSAETGRTNGILSADVGYDISIAGAQASFENSMTNIKTSSFSSEISEELIKKSNYQAASTTRLQTTLSNYITADTYANNQTTGLMSTSANVVSGVAAGGMAGVGGGAVGFTAGAIAGGLASAAGPIWSMVRDAETAEKSIFANNLMFEMQFGNTDIEKKGAVVNFYDEYSRWNGIIDPKSLSGSWMNYQIGNIYTNLTNSAQNSRAIAETGFNLTSGGNSKTRNNQDGTVENGSYTWEGTAPASRRLSKATTNNNADLAGRNAGKARDTAISAVNTGNAGAKLSAPAVNGAMSNTENALIKPIGLFTHLHLQNDSALAQAGDQFCRFGYTFNGVWSMTKLQLMKYFTYWKAEDIWVKCCRPAIEDAGETIAAIFKNGVTIWDDPDKIGAVTIYENVN